MTGNDGTSWRPSGVVTLLSDFGLQDTYVGVMKGVMLSRASDLSFVDLTHGVEPQAVLQASWLLAHAWDRFPAGTTHLAVVDPGVGGSRRILVATDRGHGFLAPDNGLLGPVLSEQARVCALDVPRVALAKVSRTFHGRDVFSPAAAALASGAAPEDLGEPAPDWRRAAIPAPEELADGWRTQVLFADHFGNLITPLAVPADAPGGRWRVDLCGRTVPLVSTYADAPVGDLLALIGSCGTLEVSLRDGDARAALDARPGDEVILRRTG